jgi:hypothetical protein
MGLLAQTAEPAKEVLGVERIAVVADRGYFKIEDIEACEKAGLDPYVPRPQRGGSVRVAAICAVNTSTGCIKRVVPVKAAEDRPRSPRRGAARVAPGPHERRSGARRAALWAPVGDQCAGAHAAELSLVTRRRRGDGD